jgi:hypothetical protein
MHRPKTILAAFQRPALLLLAFLPLIGSGCTMFYRYQVKGREFVIFSDLDKDFLKEIAPAVEEIYGGYERLFDMGPAELGRTSIILKGQATDQQVVDLAYSPSLLGYYIPFLNLISIDTKPAWTREQAMLKQILLHEIAHHFIVTQFPAASKECWLNEGLAGNLEVSLFENGRFEYPLLNPILMGIVRHAVMVNPQVGSLKKLVGLSWSEFHNDNDKELDYALAWGLVYYLLQNRFPPDMPLGEKIRNLYRMDRDLIVSFEPEWLDFLRRFDLTGRLIDLARASPETPLGRLTPRWAARQMGILKFLDDARSAPALAGLLDAPDSALRVQSTLAFVRVLARAPAASAVSAPLKLGRETVTSLLLDDAQPAGMREVLAMGLGDILHADPNWIPVLIQLLEAPQGAVRAAAARGLSSGSMKPTIVNPSFWQKGDLSARAAEVTEWQAWWSSHRRELGVMDG